MFREVRLTAAQPRLTVNLDFQAAAIVVANFTASPVYIRTGAPDIPDVTNANILIPAGTAESMPTLGRDFGLSIGNTTILPGTATLSGLFDTVVVTFLDASEKVPAFGSVNFLSLSLSDLTNGFLNVVAPNTTTAAFDLSPWGGAVLYLLPTAGSGQGVIQVQVTDSLTGTWRDLATYAFWPNVPVVLTLPRVTRYMRFIFNSTTIPGEPVIAGIYSVRASLAEIFAESYQAVGASITKTYAIAALGTQSYVFATPGLPAISIGLNRATGTDAELIVSVSQSPAGPWRAVTIREQNMGSGLGISMFRSVGGLDQYMQVSLLETSNVPMTGTLTMQVPPVTDLSGVLNNILNALGDVTSPTVNVGQNIYYVLKNMDTKLSTVNTNLGTVITSLSSINTQLGVANASLTNINAGIGTTNGILTTTNTSLGTINTSIGTTNTLIGTTNTALSTISTNIGTITAAQTRTSYIVDGFGVVPNGASQVGFLLFASSYIQAAMASLAWGGATLSAQFRLRLGWGTAGAVAQWFYTSYGVVNPSTFAAYNSGQVTGQVMTYGSNRSPGLQTPAAGNQWLWVWNGSGVNAEFGWTISGVQ